MWHPRWTPSALVALAFALPGTLSAQRSPVALTVAEASAAGGAVRASSSHEDIDLSDTALGRGRYAVVIDLDENLLSFRKGDQTLWTAPIGTGTGLRMETDKEAWDFSTPNGIFHVQFKEENPVWIAPDWFYLENKLPVPPPNDKKRYYPGGLGAAAVYIGHDLAIHGTDKPELLGQRVSHGCIRLSNRDALRLYHNVQVGTEVIVVGGKNAAAEAAAYAASTKNTFDPAPKKRPQDPLLERWRAMDSEDLLRTLDSELWLDKEISRWPEVAGILLDRGLKSADDEALAGLLASAGNLPNSRVEREYATYLADAYARNPLRTVEVLSELDRSSRQYAANAIVSATMELFHGSFDDPVAPWPTSRVPQSARDDAARAGWRSLGSAESGFRARLNRKSA
jgi:hypothetical protein